MTTYNISTEAMNLLTEAGGTLEGEWMTGFWKATTFALLAGAEQVNVGQYSEAVWHFPVSGETSRLTETTAFAVNVMTGEIKLTGLAVLKFQEYWYEDLLPALIELCKVEAPKEEAKKEEAPKENKEEDSDKVGGTPSLSIEVSDCSKTRRSIGRVYQLPTGGYPKKMRYAKAWEALAQNRVFPSVTNVISAKALELTGWAKFMMGKHIRENMNNTNDMNKLIREAQGANDRYTELACNRGSEVHLACENNILHGQEEHNFQYGGDPYYEAYKRFVADYSPEFLSVETTVYGKTDTGLYYAGTIDFIARINGRIYAGDWKTSKVLHEEVGLQLSAGINAQKMLTDNGDELIDIPYKIDGAIGVHLTPDGYNVARISNLSYCWQTFQHLREVWQWNAFGGNFEQEVLNPINSPGEL